MAKGRRVATPSVDSNTEMFKKGERYEVVWEDEISFKVVDVAGVIRFALKDSVKLTRGCAFLRREDKHGNAINQGTWKLLTERK